MSQILADIEQGSAEWHEQRLGRLTMSRLKDAMTNGRGKDTIGETAYTYMYDLISEHLTGKADDHYVNDAMRWGTDNEPQARAMYCLLRDARVAQVGFVLHSGDQPWCKYVGGSPDGLVTAEDGSLGGVEIKCPYTSRVHLRYLENGGVPKEYYWQVHGLMWLTKRDWWDFVSFDPRMPQGLQLFVHRELTDDIVRKEIESRAERFVTQMIIKLDKIKARIEQ